MCGIFCKILAKTRSQHDIDEESLSLIKNRGPDIQSLVTVDLSADFSIQLYGSVLHMRGDLCPQPLHDASTNSYLLWNGEVFGGVEVKPEENDGEVLLKLLAEAWSDHELIDVLMTVNGPFAFVYHKVGSRSLWFGRDVFGRRSLTFHKDIQNKELCLASIALHLEQEQIQLNHWREMPAAGIYKLALTSESSYDISCYPWTHSDIPPDDSLVDHTLEPISLLNFNELNADTTHIDAIPPELTTAEDILQYASIWLKAECEEFMHVLTESVRRRVSRNSFYCALCAGGSQCTESHISIMFSGGIDSMMLAYITDLCLPSEQPIDLLNVAFESSSANGYNVPDRQTGLVALAELNPNRKWNFVEIDVTREELQRTRQERISRLILPLDSVLDDSIGCAMWFASRGQGVITEWNGKTTPYCSKARVVLSGLGADEQLGGYSRHRSAYQNLGWKGLIEELKLDIRRISARNLGRDDRVISDHGKEARFPFLDEQLVSFLNELPVHRKMNLDLARGFGEKLLLRACAYRCGLLNSAAFAKRAIQFGSRIAKAENRKEKGSDKCNRLRAEPDGT